MGNAADLKWGTEGPVPTSSPVVAVDLTVTPVLSSALAHTTVPVVPRLVIVSSATVRGAVLRVSVQDADGPIGTAAESLVDLEAGRTSVLHDAGPALHPATLRQVPERRPGWVRV